MSDTEHINALIKALLSMQKRYLDSETKVEMLQEQLAHSNKRMGDLKEQLQTKKLSQEEEDWHNKTVIEGLKKTLKKKDRLVLGSIGWLIQYSPPIKLSA